MSGLELNLGMLGLAPGVGWGTRGPRFVDPLLTSITPTKGSGGTFTRNSVAWYQPAGSTTWTSASANVAAFEGGGYLSEPASTNKVTAYSVIPADTLGTELASGTVTVGQKYQITAQNTVDFTTVGAANNTVGTQFVATAATITLDATNKVKRVQWGVGEKSYHNGTSFVQNITGLNLSGASQAILSIVDDTAALTAAGLQAIAGTKVYKLDNSAGSTFAYASITGGVGNTNPHTLSISIKATAGVVYLTDMWSSAHHATATVDYSRLKKENYTPLAAGASLGVKASAASVAYFILPQLEERATVTSPMVTQGSTTTRAATVLSYPISNLPTSGPYAIKLSWKPKMAGSATGAVRYLFSSYTDANNETSILYDGTTLTFRKRIGGVNTDATKAMTTTANTVYNIVARWSPTTGTDIFAQGAKGTGNSNLTAPVLSSTFQVGSSNGVGQAQANFSGLTIYGNLGDAKAISLATP